MPPVEATTFPSSVVPVARELKVVDKAMQLPVVSDAVSEVSKYAQNISENSHVKHAYQLMGDCLRGIAENERVMNVKEAVLPLTTKHLTSMKESVLLTSVKDRVLPHVAGAVHTLDNMACGGIDQLKTAVPSLSSPTPELMETAKEAAAGYLSLFTEYLSSFSLAQLSLKMADRGLVLMENAATKIMTHEAAIPAYLRAIRRSVRTARRAGARRNHLHADSLSRSGIAGQIASTLHLNTLFGFLGLELVSAADKRRKYERRVTTAGNKDDNEDEDLPEACVGDLTRDLGDYRSDEDPDFVSGSSSSSSSSSEVESEDEVEKAAKPKDGSSSSGSEDESDDKVEKVAKDCGSGNSSDEAESEDEAEKVVEAQEESSEAETEGETEEAAEA